MPKRPAKSAKKALTNAEIAKMLRDWVAGPMPKWVQVLLRRRTPLPCPFCGGDAIAVSESEQGRMLHCHGCNAMGPDIVPSTRIKTGHAGNALAVLAWNMRAEVARG